MHFGKICRAKTTKNDTIFTFLKALVHAIMCFKLESRRFADCDSQLVANRNNGTLLSPVYLDY